MSKEVTPEYGVSFFQGHEEEKNTTRDRDRSNDQCYVCGEIGHHGWEKEKCEGTHTAGGTLDAIANVTADDDEDPYELGFCISHDRTNDAACGYLLSERDEVLDTVSTNSFNKQRIHVIPDEGIGIDSMSSVDIFGDARLLHNIRMIRQSMRIVCKAGVMTVSQVGDFVGYGTVWYHESAIANIISLNRVQKMYRVRLTARTETVSKSTRETTYTVRFILPIRACIPHQ